MEQTMPSSPKVSMSKEIAKNVWLAKLKDGKKVIVKRISLNGRNPHELREVKAGKILKDVDGIGHLLFYFNDESTSSCLLIFEYIKGVDLYSFMDKNQFHPTDESIVKKIIMQLASILSEVHKRGIAHLDIKLENIIIHPKTHKVTLIDFGLCGFETEYPCDLWVGSQDYASPEILLRKPYNACQADVYSLGVVAYALLCGQLPWNFEHKAEWLTKFGIQPRIEFPTEVKLCDEAKDMLSKMLKDSPSERITISDIISHSWFIPKTKKVANSARSPIMKKLTPTCLISSTASPTVVTVSCQ